MMSFPPPMQGLQNYCCVMLQSRIHQLTFEVSQLQAENHHLKLRLHGPLGFVFPTRDYSLVSETTSVIVQAENLNLRNELPFEKKILSLGLHSSIRASPGNFRNINVNYSGSDLSGDTAAFLNQLGPMIIEEVRSKTFEKIREIEKSAASAIFGAVDQTSAGPNPAAQRQQRIQHRVDYDFVDLKCNSAVSEFPKLDHGFMKELLCLLLPSNDDGPNQMKFVLAIGSRQMSEENVRLDGKVRYTVKILAHDYKLLLDNMRSRNQLSGRNAPDSLQHIFWHHITGLTPDSRMYEAASPNAPFHFAEQILLRQAVQWPLPLVAPGCEDLNITQTQVVQSLAPTLQLGIFELNGPPGTGKTTTIIAFLLERMRQFPEEKILLTAPSNKAIQVVLHKLVEKNDEGFAVAIIGTGKSASPDHDELYAAEFATPTVEELKALRTSSDPLHVRKSELEAIVHAARNRLEHVVNPSRKGLPVSIRTAQDVRDALRKLSRVNFSAVTSADSLNDAITEWIGSLYRIGECVECFILERAHVVFSTLVASGRKNFHKIVKKFHTVVVDEAAQALMAETFIPFKFNPARYLLVGDPKQLPATVSSSELKSHGYADSLMYVMQREMGDQSCAEMLTTQYRMHPAICKPISDLFYGGMLVTDESVLSRPCLLQQHLPAHMLLHNAPIAFVDLESVECKIDDGSIYNVSEAELVVKVVLYLLDRSVKPEQIGVVTSYTAQADLLKKLLRNSRRPHLHCLAVSTVDGFQGGEKDFMLFSCVRTSESVGFMKDERRINVAMSRGRYANWVFGQARTLRKSNSPLQRFLNWINDPSRNNVQPHAVIIKAEALLNSMRGTVGLTLPPSSLTRSSAPLVTASGSQRSPPAAAREAASQGIAPPPARPTALAVAVSTAMPARGVVPPAAQQQAWRRASPAGVVSAPSAVNSDITMGQLRGPPANPYVPPALHANATRRRF